MQKICFYIFAKNFEDKRDAHARADRVFLEVCREGPGPGAAGSGLNECSRTLLTGRHLEIMSLQSF